MSHKDDLRNQRYETVINKTSKKQEKECDLATEKLIKELRIIFKLNIEHEKNIYLEKIISKLKETHRNVSFAKTIETSSMRPDGGILYLLSKNRKNRFPILITEVKNQGTNDLRLLEGKKIQAQGNAIERLGKNVIGFRTMMIDEDIFPFVCFGYGWDFQPSSSILDRVKTIAMYGELNKTIIFGEGPNRLFKRGSFYFRQEKWSVEEMYKIMFEISSESIKYYLNKYKELF
jgi:type II restriction enzyme